MRFTCELCNRDVLRGKKFRVQLDEWESDCELNSVIYEREICSKCKTKIENKVNSIKRVK